MAARVPRTRLADRGSRPDRKCDHRPPVSRAETHPGAQRKNAVPAALTLGTLGRPGQHPLFGIRFTGQVWPGDELTLAWRVERIEDVEGTRLAHLTVTRQTGNLAITATATAHIAG